MNSNNNHCPQARELAVYTVLGGGWLSDKAYQENLLSAIAAYRECADLIERMSLFSANESLEEVATGEMG